MTQYRREHIGFVFQFYNLISDLTAWENVELAASLVDHPLSTAEVLEQVGLGERLHHFPAQLSGGEQQRVSIARAIVKRPLLLLCDEPTGALDYQTGKSILELLLEVNQLHGSTVLIVTHNAAIGAIGDRVVRMSSGRIAEIQINARRDSPEGIEWYEGIVQQTWRGIYLNKGQFAMTLVITIEDPCMAMTTTYANLGHAQQRLQ